MIQALLSPAHEDLIDGQLKQLTGFQSLIRQYDPNRCHGFSGIRLEAPMQPSQCPLESHKMNSFVRVDSLLQPSVGLVMHCPPPPSQNKSSNDFDDQNPLLKLLMDRGITASNSYGFDWHWRSEPHGRHRKCPVRGYSVELRSIHGIMTYNLLEALPLLHFSYSPTLIFWITRDTIPLTILHINITTRNETKQPLRCRT